MDAFYEEEERILGHAADSYHRIDIRQTSRNLIVRHGDRVIANTNRPFVLYESGVRSVVVRTPSGWLNTAPQVFVHCGAPAATHSKHDIS
jgi:hypothetical protein